MSKYSSKDVGFLLVGGYALLGVTTSLADSVSAVTDETTALGDSWQSHVSAGLQRGELTQDGFFDDDANSSHDALNEHQGESRVLCVGFEGNTIGKHFIGYAGAVEVSYQRLASIGTVHRANAKYSASGQVEEGVILQSHAAQTVDWNTEGAESVDSGASSSSGGAGYLQVSAYSGFSSFVGKVRHSADDVTYADLITFATVSSGPTAERKTVSGTVNRYLAFDGNVTGSGSVTVMAGFVRY